MAGQSWKKVWAIARAILAVVALVAAIPLAIYGHPLTAAWIAVFALVALTSAFFRARQHDQAGTDEGFPFVALRQEMGLTAGLTLAALLSGILIVTGTIPVAAENRKTGIWLIAAAGFGVWGLLVVIHRYRGALREHGSKGAQSPGPEIQ